MAYKVKCKECGDEGLMPQRRGLRMVDHHCKCGGTLRRVGWQERYRQLGKLQSAAQIAADLLRESGNPAIGWGDAGMLHAVAEKLGMTHESWITERKVLDRIDRSHAGVLVKRFESLPERGLSRVRRYWLPESVRTDGGNAV